MRSSTRAGARHDVRNNALLAQAVQCLDGETTSSSAGRREPIPSRNARVPGPSPGPPTSAARTPSNSSGRISALAEKNCLFNFSKRSAGSSSGGRKSKKKRLEMWNHDFVCLAKTSREKTPTSMERATLTSLGEKSGSPKSEYLENVYLVAQACYGT